FDLPNAFNQQVPWQRAGHRKVEVLNWFESRVNLAGLQPNRHNRLTFAEAVRPLECYIRRRGRTLAQCDDHCDRFRDPSLDTASPIATGPKLTLVTPKVDT